MADVRPNRGRSQKGKSVSQSKPLITIRLPGEVSRRDAMQWVLTAVAASVLPTASYARSKSSAVAAPGAPTAVKGYGTDPNLIKTHAPGAFWPLTFTAPQKKAATALADVILPKDQYGPAASELGVPAMLNEWISAPYPLQQADRPVILDGLDWIDVESNKRFEKVFAELNVEQKHAICDEICFAAKAKPPFQKPARFFSRFRSLCAGAYYTTPAGWNAIGYVGNVPLAKFDGPPAEVLAKLGVTQTVM